MQTLFSRHQHQLSRLTEQLQSRLSLRDYLASCLTAKAQQALLDAHIEGDTLHLLTTNASWASRLRLSARQLIQACQDTQVSKLNVRVAAQLSETPPASNKPVSRTPPDEATLKALTDFSDQLDPQDELTQSLQRLIAQFKRSSPQ